MLRWKYSRPLLGIFIALLALGPVLHIHPLDEPGMQQTLAVAFLYGALALTYDLLFGFTGLLSFGHALFFAAGVYLTAIFINTSHWPLVIAAGAAVAISAIFGSASGSGISAHQGNHFRDGHLGIRRGWPCNYWPKLWEFNKWREWPRAKR
ncbi:MAG: hypothetical protein WDO06_07605 [Actinomycetota bacterium]